MKGDKHTAARAARIAANAVSAPNRIRAMLEKWGLSPRRAAEIEVAMLGAIYQDAKDSRDAWAAYRLCHEHGIEIPPWVAAYLHRVSCAIEALPAQDGRIRDKLPGALEIPEDADRKRGAALRDVLLADLVTDALERDYLAGVRQFKRAAYVLEVAEAEGVSQAMVERAVRTYLPGLFEEIQRRS